KEQINKQPHHRAGVGGGDSLADFPGQYSTRGGKEIYDSPADSQKGVKIQVGIAIMRPQEGLHGRGYGYDCQGCKDEPQGYQVGLKLNLPRVNTQAEKDKSVG